MDNSAPPPSSSSPRRMPSPPGTSASSSASATSQNNKTSHIIRNGALSLSSSNQVYNSSDLSSATAQRLRSSTSALLISSSGNSSSSTISRPFARSTFASATNPRVAFDQPASYSGSGSGLLEQNGRITLLVDDTQFIVERSLFTRHAHTMLGRMFSPSDHQSITKPNKDGIYELKGGFSATIFRAILEFYRNGRISCPTSVSVQELRDACDYFLIPFNAETVRCQNLRLMLHELSNEGARQQFMIFLDELIMPEMVNCASRGERECTIVVLSNDDTYEWDPENLPPHTEEFFAQVIQSTPLFRFFRYIENRDVAKQVLKERGLKKIKIGIEGFPTFKERVRRRAVDGRVEVVYNYVQRPFIRMSWEEEEAKSRHVDFQTCVRSRSAANLAVAAAENVQEQQIMQQQQQELQ